MLPPGRSRNYAWDRWIGCFFLIKLFFSLARLFVCFSSFLFLVFTASFHLVELPFLLFLYLITLFHDKSGLVLLPPLSEGLLDFFFLENEMPP